jgi:hypothetical protein
MKRLKRGIAEVTGSVIAVGVLFVVLVTFVIPISMWTVDEYRNGIAAGQARTVQNAVNKYISDNATTIAGASSATVPYNLTVPILVNAGYLPTGYSETNNFSATYQTRIFQPASGKFHTMTFLTGGVDLKLAQARKIALRIGATGGYIEGGVAKGALGAWSENLSVFGGFNPGDGHIVIAGFYQNGAISNDYLYRKAVPGHPELNTMNTALDMGGNDVNNAATLRAANASISATVTATTANVNGTITAGNAQINGVANVNGKITGASVIQGQYFYPTQVVTVGWGCGPNGFIAQDNTGQSISCVNGIWTKSSGVPVGTIAIWGNQSIPTGWLECNGQGFNTGAYPELAAYYPWGSVPDFRGMFLRGLDRGAGRDTDTWRNVLSYQNDTLQDHSHIAGTETSMYEAPGTPTRNTPGGAEIRNYSNRTGMVNTGYGDARISSETRPKNMAVIYIIKAQ